ncbi:nucleotide-binding universal stress UspA family protein [Mycolicibacterium sp. BK556]|uniref:universal stress protein n=1 Tax=unclassified Mycolicibacterium TaxID=2636767 RepID=UPI00161AEA01|nr:MULTISPECIES: universal stress protein [unclassified Mycolicibacterium]MBB3605437.1 nucleotide-binding universal stress UspA family protein [Mycolicibacterium sp. BK556]MBB3636066.1 nucleotide-binding universal stress UspA family protein [Mycolicibacterium sp. BK607]
MTVAVGYLAGKGGQSPLYLAVEAAKTLKTSLAVVTVVPRPWMTPSLGRIDAEFAEYAEQLAMKSAAQARACIDMIAKGLDVTYRKVAHRSASGGLLEAVAELEPEVLILGSAADGKLGQVVIGSTGDRLLHSAPVPMAISPRGYRGSKSGGLTRITAAYSGTPDNLHVVERVAALDERLGVPMRVITFAVRGRTMYPPEVGLSIEDSILEQLAGHAREALAQLKTDGVVGDDVDLQVATGNGWDEALDAADWQDGDLLAIGTSPSGGIARVFLGSRGSKIMRHSPVPVLVLPG